MVFMRVDRAVCSYKTASLILMLITFHIRSLRIAILFLILIYHVFLLPSSTDIIHMQIGAKGDS